MQVIGTDPVSGESKIFEMPRGSYKCKSCDTIVFLDTRGFAFCSTCGQVYNDGFTPPPPLKKTMPYKFFKACRKGTAP